MHASRLSYFLVLLFFGISISACHVRSYPSQQEGIVQTIMKRGTLLVGTTGDYRPLSFREEETGAYWGFDLDLVKEMANRLGVGVSFVQTSWPKLTEDMLSPKLFDLAVGGITITDARREKMLMSEGYLRNGKTILCRKEDVKKYRSLDDLNQPGVRVMVNPGGLNEKFAREKLPKANIIVYQRNENIPEQVALDRADVMITEITEAPYYIEHDRRLAAPLLSTPFTHGEIGVLLRMGEKDLLQLVNTIIRQMKADGTLERLHKKYGLVYGY